MDALSASRGGLQNYQFAEINTRVLLLAKLVEETKSVRISLPE
ncbi:MULTISPECIES: hypothetical protein [Variovorax]|nr:hypothetical protein [Variovorax paradoxus]